MCCYHDLAPGMVIPSASYQWLGKKDVTPVLMHWSYIFLALIHGYLRWSILCGSFPPVLPCGDSHLWLYWLQLVGTFTLCMMTSSNGNIFHVAGPLWGKPPVTSGFSSQRPVTWIFDVFFMCAWTNDWANSPDAGDTRYHAAQCDITVMSFLSGTFLHPMPYFNWGNTYKSKSIYLLFFVMLKKRYLTHCTLGV